MKIDKKDVIEVGKYDEMENDMTKMKWNFFEVHHLIAI